ncbi:MAG TPA: TorF family putative porin [Bacteroidales bacterium]|nr:TorF family putative porin [Bacteroidales bacterium]
MKKVLQTSGLVSLVLIVFAMNVQGQETESKAAFDVKMDIYSNYIWRGSKLGTGPSLQPSVTFTAGGLTLGVWGAFDASGYTEADPYISYAFPFGLSLGVTDYYYPSLKLSDFSDSTGSHAIELNAGFTTGGLSLSANYIVNEAGGAASKGQDMYFQAGYAFKNFSVSVGAGDGWHTTNGDFNVCHIGIGTSKEIKITDTFSIPVSGQVIVNPEKEALYVVVGLSL